MGEVYAIDKEGCSGRLEAETRGRRRSVVGVMVSRRLGQDQYLNDLLSNLISAYGFSSEAWAFASSSSSSSQSSIPSRS